MQALLTVVLGAIGTIILMFVSALFTAIPVMLLWDWLMPALFHLVEITLFQAWGLAWLCGILIKGSSK